MKDRNGKGKWLVPVGATVALLFLIVIGVLAYGRLARDPGQASLPGPPELETTAEAALKTATSDARGWQKDAELVGAVAHRQNAGSPAQGIDWAFQFYSSSAQRLALIVVADGQTRRLRDALSPYPVATISRSRWRVSSDEALQAWWDRGGRYLVTRRPDAELTLRLGAGGDEADDIVWTVIGSVPDEASDFVVRLSGIDGHVLQE